MRKDGMRSSFPARRVALLLALVRATADDACADFCTESDCASLDLDASPPLRTRATAVWPPRPRADGAPAPAVAVLLASLVTRRLWVERGLGAHYVRRVLAPLDADLFVYSEVCSDSLTTTSTTNCDTNNTTNK